MYCPVVKWNNTPDHSFRFSGCMTSHIQTNTLSWTSPDISWLAIVIQIRDSSLKAILLKSVKFQVERIRHHLKRVYRCAQVKGSRHNLHNELNPPPPPSLIYLLVVLAVTDGPDGSLIMTN